MVVDHSSGSLVYLDSPHQNNSFTRVFGESVDSSELVWHRDKRNRKVEVISGSGWKFQYDNGIPFELKVGNTLTIEAYEYHRIIKGTTDLILRITEYD